MGFSVELAIDKIRNTQRAVQNRIDGGHGRQVPLVPWASELLLGSLTLAQIRQIRVSRRAAKGSYYSADNRRVFVLKST